jgi:hypothetical protein
MVACVPPRPRTGRASGQRYWRVWMSLVNCLCTQHALPKSTTLHFAASSRSPKSAGAAAAPSAAAAAAGPSPLAAAGAA